jgi:hypothetical protein
MFRSAESFRRAFASAVVLTVGAAVPAAAQVTYDNMRTITECTTYPKSSCAALSIWTYDLKSGGSFVSIGLSNLQGLNPLDNTGGTLLTEAGFTFGRSEGLGNTVATVAGVPSLGAYGSGSMTVYGGSSAITLLAPYSYSGGFQTRSVTDSIASCTRYISTYCTAYDVATSTHSASYFDATSTTSGIPGRYATGVPIGTVTKNPDTRSSPDVVREPDYLYSCSFFDVTCTCPFPGYDVFDRTCHYPVYDVGNDAVSSGLSNRSVYQFNPIGYGYTGDSFGFSFSFYAPALYDAADVTSAWFDSDSDVIPGEGYSCDPPTGCVVYTDQLTNYFKPAPVAPVVATPEPASLVLLGTGLLSLAAYHRRRRAGIDARD